MFQGLESSQSLAPGTHVEQPPPSTDSITSPGTSLQTPSTLSGGDASRSGVAIGRTLTFQLDDASEEKNPPRKPLGQWLIENMPRGVELELPDRSSNRPIPFIDEEDDA